MGLVTAAGEHRYGWWNGKDDLRLAVVAADGVGIVSVSPSRRMINVFRTGPEVQLWIPGGLSWYRSDRIKRIIQSENRQKELDQLFFYNFGFTGDKVMTLARFEDWKTNRNLILNLGIYNWVRYKMLAKNMLTKEDTYTDKMDRSDLTEEIFQRDFSDDGLVDEQLRVTVINASEWSGMASWLASRLEWMGMSVVGLETSEEKVNGCRFVISGEETRKLKSYKAMHKLWKCESLIDDNMEKMEMEIYLGGGFGEMIKYSSYTTPVDQ